MSRPGMEGQRVRSLSCFREWVYEQLGSVRHERRVSAICRILFEKTLPLHDLNRNDLRLLKLAAYLHDIGRSVNNKNHPTEGARIIRRESDLPLKKRQRRMLAYVALRHRGRVPEASEDRALSRVSDKEKARLILAFLRAADTLDSRWLAGAGAEHFPARAEIANRLLGARRCTRGPEHFRAAEEVQAARRDARLPD